MRELLVSQTAAKQLDDLPAKERKRVVAALRKASEDPFRARPGADIKRLEGTEPPKYRLRVGDLRVVYLVTETDIRVIEVFGRGRGYRLG